VGKEKTSEARTGRADEAVAEGQSYGASFGGSKGPPSGVHTHIRKKETRHLILSLIYH